MGMLNAYGLTNAGVEVCARDIRRPATRAQGHPQYLSRIHQGHGHRHPGDPGGCSIYQRSLGPHFQALELNYSCPNSEEAIAKNVVQALQSTRKVRSLYPRLFLIAKLSILPPLRVRPGTGAHRGQRPPCRQHYPLQYCLSVAALPPERGWRRWRLRGAVIPPGLKVQSGIAAKSAPVFDHGLRRHVRRRRPALLRPRRRRGQPVHPGPPEA